MGEVEETKFRGDSEKWSQWRSEPERLSEIKAKKELSGLNGAIASHDESAR